MYVLRDTLYNAKSTEWQKTKSNDSYRHQLWVYASDFIDEMIFKH